MWFATAAVYKCAAGLYLRAGLDPLDGKCAALRFGRLWRLVDTEFDSPPERGLLSNGYAVLARRFGFELPDYYPLHNGEHFRQDVREIVNDIDRTLPALMSKTTLNDLIEVEAEKFGAKWQIDRQRQRSEAMWISLSIETATTL